MARTDLLKGLAVFAVVVAVVLASTAATGALLSGSPSNSSAPNVSAYDTDTLLTTPVADDGTVDAVDQAESKTVVIDLSHGNAVSKDAMQPMVDALVSDGHQVRFYSGGDDQSFGASGSSTLNSTLQSADAFVVANPASSYTAGEINGVESFAEAGGRVLLLADPVPKASTGGSSIEIPLAGSSGSTSSPGQPTNLATEFGITFGSGYLYDMDENANNYQSVYAGGVGNGSLSTGVDRLVVRDATPLQTSANATTVAQAEGTSLSSTRRAGTYTVAARVGNLAAVGDTSFLSPASATLADNDAFVSNLATFLVSGEKEPGAPNADSGATQPGGITQPPSGNVTAP
ncbi:DUF4350 domain-containing protein [Halorientalis salina]|uniref:DUF4350 domain-containing protein n=1 Tax=Halorientalis salina TaxID=2932266 RepID=UPI0010AD17C5|nr:DUF4350 domain-containing protein [Halorientalis salina]